MLKKEASSPADARLNPIFAIISGSRGANRVAYVSTQKCDAVTTKSLDFCIRILEVVAGDQLAHKTGCPPKTDTPSTMAVLQWSYCGYGSASYFLLLASLLRSVPMLEISTSTMSPFFM